MRLKTVFWVTCTMLLVGCGKVADVDNGKALDNNQTVGRSELETIGDVNVEKELFDVKITIPADFVGETSQEDLDISAKEEGWESAVKNADGSVTYTMTRSQHKKLMKEYADKIDSTLSEMCGSENYPNFVSIEANSDYTNYKVVTKSSELGFNESFSVMAFYMYSGMYHIFNGTSVDNVHVDFINEASGNIISSSDSKDMN